MRKPKPGWYNLSSFVPVDCTVPCQNTYVSFEATVLYTQQRARSLLHIMGLSALLGQGVNNSAHMRVKLWNVCNVYVYFSFFVFFPCVQKVLLPYIFNFNIAHQSRWGRPWIHVIIIKRLYRRWWRCGARSRVHFCSNKRLIIIYIYIRRWGGFFCAMVTCVCV